MRPTRREWLRGTASAAGGLALAAEVKRAMAAGGADWVKVGMCDWSMGRTNLRAFPLAKKIGLDGIEVSIGNVKNDLWLRKPEMQAKYLAAARKHNMAIPSMAMGLLNSVPLISDERAAPWVADTIEVAKKLGARIILLAFFGRGKIGKDSKEDKGRLVEILKDLAPRAEKAGVVLGLENLLSAEANLGVIEQVKSKHVQVYYDVYNSQGEGYDVVREIKRMGKSQICQVHFKEGPKLLGSGKIDWPAVAAALNEIKYRGWLVLETSSPNRDVLGDTRKNLKYLKKLFGA